jgi:hypothetical protein
LLSLEIAIALIPLAPLASLNLYFFSPVIEFHRKADGAEPTYPETAHILSSDIEIDVISSV